MQWLKNTNLTTKPNTIFVLEYKYFKCKEKQGLENIGFRIMVSSEWEGEKMGWGGI